MLSDILLDLLQRRNALIHLLLLGGKLVLIGGELPHVPLTLARSTAINLICCATSDETASSAVFFGLCAGRAKPMMEPNP